MTVLQTDAYKFPMAEAGFPLRPETFYYSHRRGGPAIVPFDIEKWVQNRLPVASPGEVAYLQAHGLPYSPACRKALRSQITIRALPKGEWFTDREPVFSVAGASALPSWLEPTVLMLNRSLQVATCALLHPEKLSEMCSKATCQEEADITNEALDAVGVRRTFQIQIMPEQYMEDVAARTWDLIQAVGDPNRLFEVGLRAASCQNQHLLALRAIQSEGVDRTSNVYGASRLNMGAVGTMGHEHIMRMGSSYAAFAAMRDRVPGFIFFLPDTYDTLTEGVPSAIQAILECPDRSTGIRFDSEDGMEHIYRTTVAACRTAGVEPHLALESGWDLVKTQKFEQIRIELGWPAEKQSYGLGGYFVKPSWPSFQRDTVSAVWKLSQSGSRMPMKFGDDPGGAKASLPGRPVLWRSLADSGPIGYVAQEGESWAPPGRAKLITGAPTCSGIQIGSPARGLGYSPGTQALIYDNRVLRKKYISDCRGV